MNIDDTIFFAPGLKAIDVDFNNRAQILRGFHSRINDYYLSPARILDGHRLAFATGVLLMTTIDAITYYTMEGFSRIGQFIKTTSAYKEFSEAEQINIERNFRDSFRNGLVHEGRIKKCGQFSYDFPWLLFFQNGFMILNPNILLTTVDDYYRKFMIELRTNDIYYSRFLEKLKFQFESDIESLRRLYR